MCNGGIARLDVMLVSSEPSLPLVVDDPVESGEVSLDSVYPFV